jgi:hypothetical protein
MTITTEDVLEIRPWDFCAFCDVRASHYTISALPNQDTEDNRYLRSCIDCFNELVAGSNTAGCAYCDNLAQYGSVQTKRVNKFGSRTSVDIRYAPDARVLCEHHFSEIRDEVEDERKQYRIKDFLDQN